MMDIFSFRRVCDLYWKKLWSINSKNYLGINDILFMILAKASFNILVIIIKLMEFVFVNLKNVAL